MSVDPSRGAVIHLWHRETGARANFDVIVYGVTANELTTVPNDVITSIARKYPDYVGSPFGVKALHNGVRRARSDIGQMKAVARPPRRR